MQSGEFFFNLIRGRRVFYFIDLKARSGYRKMMQCVATVLIVVNGLVISSHAKENQCPGGKTSCPDDSTCCVLSNGSFDCCPIQNAVCCGDSVHCCPDGYTCDVIKGICKMGTKSVPLLKKIPAKPIMVPATKKRAFDSASDGAISPDKNYQCPKKGTCCKLPSGTYGCCPLEGKSHMCQRAVCCSDHKHCCPKGYTCDVEAGKCKKRAEHIKMIEKIQFIKTSVAGDCIRGLQTKTILQKTSALETKKISAGLAPHTLTCPDGSQCYNRDTCCERPDGSFICCPIPNAVCCKDGYHCCYPGTTCNLKSRSCHFGSQSIPMFQKMPATEKHAFDDGNVRLPMLKKAKSPRPNRLTLVPEHPHGGDPVTDDD